MANSKELKALAKDFSQKTEIKVFPLEERTIFHWKRLVFRSGLNCEQMDTVSQYIKDTFSTKGIFTHLSPTVGVHNGNMCLTVRAEQVQEFILKEKINS